MSGERGWLPELLHTGGRFVRNTALFADATGKIHRSGEFVPVNELDCCTAILSTTICQICG
jgi:hypothetical protein